MTNTKTKNSKIPTSIAPWFTVENCVKASEFYKSAFGAVETYRLETPDGLIVKLAIDGAEFWIAGGIADAKDSINQALGGDAVRMILTVANPDLLFDRALKAGTKQIYPIGEDHGWRLGRLCDPFGLHWEIGHPIDS